MTPHHIICNSKMLGAVQSITALSMYMEMYIHRYIYIYIYVYLYIDDVEEFHGLTYV